MADSNKNILITPATNTTNQPSIEFKGSNVNTTNIKLTVLDDGTVSFYGGNGQLFSISDDMTGSIFSVNDISGIPSLEVFDSGEIRLGEFSGNILIGKNVDTGEKVQITGDMLVSGLVNGRDLSADGIKLDGIEDGAQVNDVTSVSGRTGAVVLTKTDVGLSNVDNTSDSTKNVLSATKLTTARTISLSGDATGSISFNGTSNVTIPVTIADDSHNHIISNIDGLQTALDSKMKLYNGWSSADFDTLTTNGVYRATGTVNSPSGGSHNTMFSFLQSDGNYGSQLSSPGSGVLYHRYKDTTWGEWNRIFTDSYHPNADKWTSGINLTLSGDLSGVVGFDGSSNVTLSATVKDDSHNHIISNIDGLQTALVSKVSTNSNQALHATDALSLTGNILYLNKADGSNENVDLSLYLDDTNLARIVSGTYDSGTQELVFTRDDNSEFRIDASMFFDDTNLVTSVDGRTGAVTLTNKYLGISSKAVDSDKLDGLNSTQFLRSDTNDTFTGNLSMNGLVTFNTSSINNGFLWNVNSDLAGINFKNTTDGDTNSYLNFFTRDNGNEYIKFSHQHYVSGNTDWMDIKNGTTRVNGDIFVNSTQSGDYDLGTNTLTGGDKVFNDGYHPNADKLTTARTIGGVSFDGTANINLPGVNISGNQNTTGSAAKLTTARTIALSGDATGSINFDGSADVTIPVTIADDSHNHTIANVDGLQTALDGKLSTTGKAADSDKLDGLNSTQFLRSDTADTFTSLTGTTLTATNILATSNGTGTAIKVGDDVYLGDINEANVLNIRGSQDPTKGYINFGNSSGNSNLGSTGGSNLTWGSNNVFHDGYHPNADKLTTTRTIGGVSFDGTANINLPGVNISGNQNTTGSAAKLTTARTIALSGDVSGSVSFDGSANAIITATVADDSHNHIISNVDGLQTVLDGKLGTTGKAADSNLLDGLDSTQFLRSDTADTMSGELTVTNNLYADYFVQRTHGDPRSNLGNPTVTEMALFEEQFNNKTWDFGENDVIFEYFDGTNWIEDTVNGTVTNKKRLFRGDNAASVNLSADHKKYRLTITAKSYVYLNAMYMYTSIESNNWQIHIWKQNMDNTWVQHTNSTKTVNTWPGHVYLPFNTIPFNPSGTQGTHYKAIQVEIIPTVAYVNSPTIHKLQLWGGYPAAKRRLYSVDDDLNSTFQNKLTATNLVATSNITSTSATINGTLTANNLIVGTSNAIQFANNDYIRYNDADGLGSFSFDVDGGVANAKIKASEFHGTLANITGNILVSGTVDGRDISSDGTKLDNIGTFAEFQAAFESHYTI